MTNYPNVNMNGDSSTVEAGGRPRRTAKDYSIFIKSGSVAMNSLLLAGHLAGNAKMLAMLAPEGDAAGSIVSTFQTVVLGSATGCLLSTGIEMGKAVGLGEYERAGQIAKASWVLTIGLGLASSMAMAATPLIFPHVYEEKTAKIASDFFLGYAVGGIPELMMMNSPQIAFQAGEWYIPMAAGVAAYGPSAALSYLFAFPMKMGAFGVGLGGSAAAYLSTAGIQLWLRRRNYDPFKLYEFPIVDLKKNLMTLLKIGGQVAFQRLTEWGSLFAMTLAMANAPSKVLSASQPAIQYTAILALSLQGLAHATTMMTTSNRAMLTQAKAAGDFDRAEDLHQKNIYTLVGNNAIGALICAALTSVFYFKRKALSGFFLSDDAEEETHDLAQLFLWINMIGMVPDAVRIVSLGALRSWEDVFWPTFACLTVMTGVGVPVGYGVSESEDDWSQMYIVRDAAIAVSAIIVAHRCMTKVAADDRSINLSEATPLIQGSPSDHTNKLCGFLSTFCKDKSSGQEEETPVLPQTFGAKKLIGSSISK